MAATTWIPAPATRPAPRRAPAGARPALRPVVPAGGRRRRLGAVVLATILAVGLVVGVVARVGAEPAPAAAGHVVLGPGETLWDVAVRTAGPGVDPRAQLRDLVLLNDLDPAVAPAAWTVVLLPAR